MLLAPEQSKAWYVTCTMMSDAKYMWPNTTKGTSCLLLNYLTEDLTSFPMIPNS